MPQSGVTAAFLKLQRLVQVSFCAQMPMLQRRQRFGVASPEGLRLRGMGGEECAFRADLRKAHKMALKGFIMDESALFLQLTHTESFQTWVVEAALKSDGAQRGMFNIW